MGEPLKGFGWIVVQCIFAWFATLFIKTMCGLFLAIGYIRSYYKMHAILTNSKPYFEKYINYFKWTVIVVLGILSLSLGINNIVFYWHAFKNDPNDTFNLKRSNDFSKGIYWAVLIVETLIALLFCYTVVKVWIMLSSRRYGFMVKKNVPSMVVKLLFNTLNCLAVFMVMITFNSFLGSLL